MSAPVAGGTTVAPWTIGGMFFIAFAALLFLCFALVWSVPEFMVVSAIDFFILFLIFRDELSCVGHRARKLLLVAGRQWRLKNSEKFERRAQWIRELWRILSTAFPKSSGGRLLTFTGGFRTSSEAWDPGALFTRLTEVENQGRR